MYTIWRSVDVSFAHHVRGHRGSCINLHGHTWKLEVCAAAAALDAEGFVVDFRRLQGDVLQPAHALLDHALALGEESYGEVAGELQAMGAKLVASRAKVHGEGVVEPERPALRLAGADNRFPGGMKVAVFPFSPTSERLAEWLWRLANEKLTDARVSVPCVRVYETLHPVQSVAEFRPG
ncbi:MAG: 6-carboxytetrahydropterin synthase [Deltaproteobacteria bacterium]|nr:6-carboxytetrahydropterin synthase [Deltaproteobacteria bacterium]